MTQTTSAVVFGNAAWIGFSTNGTTYADISGISQSIEPAGFELETAATYTSGTTTAIVTTGNFSPSELTIRALYSETAGDFWTVLEAAYRAKTALKVAWAPRGNTSGYLHFITGTGYISKMSPPSGEAAGADPIATEFTVYAPSIAAPSTAALT